MRKLIPLLLILTTLYAQAQAQCDASFSFLVNGANVKFESDTTRPGLLHRWHFGDGNQGFGSTTAHTYNASGVYQVIHIISDSLGTCNDTAVKNVTIDIQASCHASFVSFKDSISPNQYHFISTSTASGGTIQSYEWTINGNFASSAQGFTTTLSPGTSLVCLTINTSSGCKSSTCDSVLVDTSHCNVNTGFFASVSRDTVFVHAFDSAVNHLHFWKFGDGSQGFGQVTMHRYSLPGTYVITHYVTDSASHCTDSAKKTITISAPVSCNASFVVKKDSLVANKYQFISTSTATGGAINSYKWRIDGTVVSTEPKFSQVLTQGTHLVCLLIGTSAGCSSQACDSIKVDTSGNHCKLNPNFTAIVKRDSVFLQAKDSTPHVLHQWKFGDGTQGFGRKVVHIYNAPGVYVVTHYVKDSSSNCVDSAKQLVTIITQPRCQASFKVLRDSVQPKRFTFLSTSTAQGGAITAYRWTLNGHVVASTNVWSTTLNKGVHLVCLTIKTSAGCVSTACDSVVVKDSVITKDSIPLVNSFPNPAPGGSVNLQLTLETQAKVKVTVYNSRGNVVFTQERNYSAGYNRLSIPVDDLQRGQYFIDIQYGNTRKRSVFQKL